MPRFEGRGINLSHNSYVQQSILHCFGFPYRRVLHKNPSSGKMSTQLFGKEFFDLYATAVWEDGFFGEHSQLHCR